MFTIKSVFFSAEPQPKAPLQEKVFETIDEWVLQNILGQINKLEEVDDIELRCQDTWLAIFNFFLEKIKEKTQILKRIAM